MFVLVIPLTLVVLLGLSSENFPEKGRNCLCEEARKLVINQVLGERVAMAKAKKKKKVSKENWTKLQERQQWYVR